jgi:hypothetical protein
LRPSVLHFRTGKGHRKSWTVHVQHRYPLVFVSTHASQGVGAKCSDRDCVRRFFATICSCGYSLPSLEAAAWWLPGRQWQGQSCGGEGRTGALTEIEPDLYSFISKIFSMLYSFFIIFTVQFFTLVYFYI